MKIEKGGFFFEVIFIVGQGIPIEVEFDEKTGKTYQYVLLAEKGNGIGSEDQHHPLRLCKN